jgi:hypothetical protein
MTTFDSREKAYENKFAHDEELKFKIMARRNKLLGLWAAEQMGISGDEATAYAAAVIKADFEEAGDEDVLRKIRQDFDMKGISLSNEAVREKMMEYLAEAERQLG